MNSCFLLRLTRFFILLFVQVLVCNHIHLFNYITPLVIGYMVVCFRRNASRTGMLLWGFSIGLLFDMFSNTAGMAAASCTLIAMIQPAMLAMFTPHDAEDDFTPSILSLGFWNYTFYVFLLMLVLHGVFYLLDAFTLADGVLTILSIVGGATMTTVIIIGIELLVRSNKRRKDYD